MRLADDNEMILRKCEFNDGMSISAVARVKPIIKLLLADRERLIEALKEITKKYPQGVSRNEAADMACEFWSTAAAALTASAQTTREIIGGKDDE